MIVKGDSIEGIIDNHTGEPVSFVKTTTGFDGTTITSTNEYGYVDNVLIIKLSSQYGGGYAKRVFDHVDVRWYGVVGDGVTDDSAAFYTAVSRCVRHGVALTIPDHVSVNLNGGTIIMPVNARLEFTGGIIKNGTIRGNKTYINAPIIQIFDTDIALEGSFSMDYICPQHFGAKVNQSIVSENECSEEIQKCLDSPINVYFPQGFYYIDTTVNVSTPKTLRMVGVNINDNISNPLNSTLSTDHARIYTDKDIDVLDILTSGVDVYGIFDTSRVPTFTKSVIRYDTNYNVWGGNLNVFITGSPTSLEGAGNGGRAIYFDQSNVTEQNGYAVDIKIRGYLQYYHTGIQIDSNVDGKGTYVNSLDIDVTTNGMKRDYYAESGSISNVRILSQSRPVLYEGEKDLYAITVRSRSVNVDVFLWDLHKRMADGSEEQANSFDFTGGDLITLGPRTQYFYNIRNIKGTSAISTPPIINPVAIISKDMLNINNSVISKLDSETGAFDKRHVVSIKAFKGTGFDFDSELDEADVEETEDVVIRNQNQFFRYTGIPAGIEFLEGADLENDFVEMVLEPSSGTFEWSRFYIFFNRDVGSFRRIQLIEHYEDSTKVAYNEYFSDRGTSKGSAIFILPLKTSTKTIIRFIGTYDVNIIYVNDIAATRRRAEVLPYIHIDGGQRIYGSLEANGLHNTSSDYTTPLRLGDYRLWVDSDGKLRIKNGAPSSDTDGSLVGT